MNVILNALYVMGVVLYVIVFVISPLITTLISIGFGVLWAVTRDG